MSDESILRDEYILRGGRHGSVFQGCSRTRQFMVRREKLAGLRFVFLPFRPNEICAKTNKKIKIK
jgi:hypothetical protein